MLDTQGRKVEMNAILEQLSIIDDRIAQLQAERAHLLPLLEDHVKETGTAMGYGYVATFKPGRASTDHEQAARDAGVAKELVKKYSTTKTTVQWAKVTKEARINTESYTTRGEPVFVIEVVK